MVPKYVLVHLTPASLHFIIVEGNGKPPVELVSLVVPSLPCERNIVY